MCLKLPSLKCIQLGSIIMRMLSVMLVHACLLLHLEESKEKCKNYNCKNYNESAKHHGMFWDEVCKTLYLHR